MAYSVYQTPDITSRKPNPVAADPNNFFSNASAPGADKVIGEAANQQAPNVASNLVHAVGGVAGMVVGRFTGLAIGIGNSIARSGANLNNLNLLGAQRFVPFVTTGATKGGVLASKDLTNYLNMGVAIEDTKDFRGFIKPMASNTSEVVYIETTPTVTDIRAAAYDEYQTLHAPAPQQVFNRVAAREITLDWKLVSRNQSEATKNLKYLVNIRRWIMPDFGNKTHVNTIGAPPPVLQFGLYGDSHFGYMNKSDGSKEVKSYIPCVMTGYNFHYPDDVDYIPTDGLEPFPVIATISVTLKESWSPKDMMGDNDMKVYRDGSYVDAMRNTDNDKAQTKAADSTVAKLPSNLLASSLPKNSGVLSAVTNARAGVMSSISTLVKDVTTAGQGVYENVQKKVAVVGDGVRKVATVVTSKLNPPPTDDTSFI